MWEVALALGSVTKWWTESCRLRVVLSDVWQAVCITLCVYLFSVRCIM
jgi:hypothetical protein